MILHGKSDLQGRRKSIRNGKYVRKYKNLSRLLSLTDNGLLAVRDHNTMLLSLLMYI